MAKKILIAGVLFYLLGVFGVACAYLANQWDADWSLGYLILAALKLGVAWPLLVFQLFGI